MADSDITVGIDADDTLWHSEVAFQAVETQYRDLLVDHGVDPAVVASTLLEVEKRNVSLYGYGVKSFVLSMIENAIALTDGQLPASAVASVVELGRWLLEHPVELLDGVAETLGGLAHDYPLILITKGDLTHQGTKIEASGLRRYFRATEIVPEKNPDDYRRVLDHHSVDPAAFVMVGNSVRSDILPVLELGGRAIHIPHAVTWAAEIVEPDPTIDFLTAESFTELPNLLANLTRK